MRLGLGFRALGSRVFLESGFGAAGLGVAYTIYLRIPNRPFIVGSGGEPYFGIYSTIGTPQTSSRFW